MNETDYNPYRGFGGPVSGDMFVGRKEIVGEIAGCLESGNVFLTGLHRMGKSSVAQAVLERLSPEKFKVCRIVNLNSVKTEYDLFRMMLTTLGLSAARTLTRGDDFQAFMDAQDAIEDDCRARSRRVVMVLDEMDGILSFDNAVLTLNRLRELAYYPRRFGINFLFVSSRSLKTIEDKMKGSNLSGICSNYFLKRFDREEVRSFVGKCGIVDDGFDEEVCALTGGVPYLMAVLLSAFCERTGSRRMDMSSVERMAALSECVSDVTHAFLEYYEKVKTTLADVDSGWGELIGLLIGPVVKARDPLLVNLFQEYGIIEKDGNCHSRHFTDYLDMCSRNIAPFEDLRSVETGLRKIVKERLVGKFGDDWAAQVCIELPCVSDGLDKARRSLEKEIRQFHLAAVDDLIEFTDLGDIKAIVSSDIYWKLFQHDIGMGLADFRKHMDNIIRMRNRTMHHRPGELIPPEQVAMARESCKAMLGRIS